MTVPGFGEVFVYADNGGAGYTPSSLAKAGPLVLNHAFAADRMATVRRLATDCARLNIALPPELRHRIEAAQASLERADTAKDRVARVRHSMESLRESLWAGDMLVFARAQARVARQGTRPGFLFGCNGFFMDNNAYRQTFQGLFNYATLPIYRGWVEPRKGQPDYSRLDHLLDALNGSTILPKIHPLIWLEPEATPEWEKNISYEETRELAIARVRESVARFRHWVHIISMMS